jgi:hypothetical protein
VISCTNRIQHVSFNLLYKILVTLLLHLRNKIETIEEEISSYHTFGILSSDQIIYICAIVKHLDNFVQFEFWRENFWRKKFYVLCSRKYLSSNSSSVQTH